MQQCDTIWNRNDSASNRVKLTYIYLHTTPAAVLQNLSYHPECRHQPSAISFSVQSTLDRMALPLPCQKKNPV